jgi:hypothetical protein
MSGFFFRSNLLRQFAPSFFFRSSGPAFCFIFYGLRCAAAAKGYRFNPG